MTAALEETTKRRRWPNPFKTKSSKRGIQCCDQSSVRKDERCYDNEEDVPPKTFFLPEVELSPTSILTSGSSTLSSIMKLSAPPLAPIGILRGTDEENHPVPKDRMAESTNRNQNGDEEHHEEEATQQDDKQNDCHHAGVVTPTEKAECTHGSTTSSAPCRRSSMKKRNAPRRASISFRGVFQVNDLPGRKGPVRRRTCVAFYESVRVKDITTIDQLTDKPEVLWFQDEEYQRIRQKSYALVDKVENDTSPDGKKYCIRGLEKMMPKNIDKARQRKYDVWDAVMDEQGIQRQDGTFDDEYLGNVSTFVTRSSQQEAIERAQMDAAAIENYMRSTRRRCSHQSMQREQ